MAPLSAVGETNARRFSGLYDRWALGTGAPQRYGWMGACTGPGAWKPRPIDDEPGLDARRRQAGLAPMDDYVATQAKSCR